MAGFANILVVVAVAAVALVLFAGFFNLIRGGDGAAARSQTLMRWRIGMQFVALLVIVALLYFKSR